MEITFRILCTDFAINQLKDIFDYHLIKASHTINQRLIKKIIDATIILENNPKAGRKEDFLKTDLRRISSPPGISAMILHRN
jgi:plasmid stabilization system protein ParE